LAHLGIVDGHAQVHVAEITPAEPLLAQQTGMAAESSQVSVESRCVDDQRIAVPSADE
jgi:hypothetical protein